MNNGGNCFLASVSQKRCYCPYDYSGKYCEVPNQITCTLSLQSPSTNCVGQSGSDYNFNVKGDPPCNRINLDSFLNIQLILIYIELNNFYRFQANCNNNQFSNYQGIKADNSTNYTSPLANSLNLTYNYSSSNVKLFNIRKSLILA